ncbi:MAG: ATP-grasp domain-containing protein [Alphaproteobacteria bacterium]|nr:ATP-grasp domain-containing protein [Alphaproteobacteria bacterium]
MIRKLLIANRGEIAVRVAQTCRRMDIDTVAVYSDADRGALHVRACDEAVRVGAAPPSESYLNTEAILAAARRSGADAVHPGYGFLSENAAFAQAVIDAGLTWVGPPPSAIEAMGQKVQARALMQDAGVPVVPGTHDPTQFERVGFPLLVKADAGGGGRGMRLVREASELEEALASARREAGAAFGSDRVFLERYVERARHVEVQVFGDTHGTVIHLGERECSVQRRHQKVIEESPSPAVDEVLRARLGEAAVRAAQTVGYVGAGTVEFLLDDQTGVFYFLEMNTRLQVEHRVTERVFGVDLVRMQLEVAEGAALPDVGRMRGAAIEARLYAEDADQGYLPQSGTVLDFFAPVQLDVTVDRAVEAGDAVSIHYDPMIAKVIARGADREQARRRLLRALRDLSVLGLTTNRRQLMAILEHPEFVRGEATTAWLSQVALPPPSDTGRPFARLCALAHELTQMAPRVPGVPPGWRSSRFRDAELSVDGEPLRWRTEGAGWRVSDGDVSVLLEVEPLGGGALRVGVDSHLRTARVVATAEGWWVHTPDGQFVLNRDPRFPDTRRADATGGCVAPMPGKVLRVEVAPKDTITKGQALIVLEAMKMEQTLRAPRDGVVAAVRAQVGEQVDTGAVLIELEPVVE